MVSAGVKFPLTQEGEYETLIAITKVFSDDVEATRQAQKPKGRIFPKLPMWQARGIQSSLPLKRLPHLQGWREVIFASNHFWAWAHGSRSLNIAPVEPPKP